MGLAEERSCLFLPSKKGGKLVPSSSKIDGLSALPTHEACISLRLTASRGLHVGLHPPPAQRGWPLPKRSQPRRPPAAAPQELSCHRPLDTPACHSPHTAASSRQRVQEGSSAFRRQPATRSSRRRRQSRPGPAQCGQQLCSFQLLHGLLPRQEPTWLPCGTRLLTQALSQATGELVRIDFHNRNFNWALVPGPPLASRNSASTCSFMPSNLRLSQLSSV